MYVVNKDKEKVLILYITGTRTNISPNQIQEPPSLIKKEKKKEKRL